MKLRQSNHHQCPDFQIILHHAVYIPLYNPLKLADAVPGMDDIVAGGKVAGGQDALFVLTPL